MFRRHFDSIIRGTSVTIKLNKLFLILNTEIDFLLEINESISESGKNI